MRQPGAFRSGTLGFTEPGVYRDGVLGMVQPGAYQSGSLGFAQPGAYRSGTLGTYAQPGAINSGSLGCGCGSKPTSGLGATVRAGTLNTVNGLGRALGALGAMSLNLDFLVGAGLVGGGVLYLLKQRGGC